MEASKASKASKASGDEVEPQVGYRKRGSRNARPHFVRDSTPKQRNKICLDSFKAPFNSLEFYLANFIYLIVRIFARIDEV